MIRQSGKTYRALCTGPTQRLWLLHQLDLAFSEAAKHVAELTQIRLIKLKPSTKKLWRCCSASTSIATLRHCSWPVE